MPLTARKSAARKFVGQIRRSNVLHHEYLDDESMRANYQALTEWQLDYLLPFFSDLYVQEGYQDAIEFVVSDLSGVGIADRDRDLERVAPLISRMLPTKALQTIAVGAEMNARILEINIGLCRRLLVDGAFPDPLSERSYLRALRTSTTLEECLDIVAVLGRLGESLDGLVRVPLISGTLRAMRVPAHAAGFGALQEFLENGFTTFKAIPDVPEFLEVLIGRTTAIFERSFSRKATARA